MKIIELSVLYLLIGIGAGIGLLVTSKPAGATRLFDALLLVPLWPIYGPLLISRPPAQGVYLSALVPDRDLDLAVQKSLDVARERIRKIDRLLEHPDFSESDAREKIASEVGRSSATARARIQHIRHLKKMRQRFQTDLDEIEELLKQLRVQAEVVRLSGGDSEVTEDLIAELMSRIESLDVFLTPETPNLSN